MLTYKMAPTGRGSLRPYQPSKFQPFLIVCLVVTVIVVGFNFWNLMKKNSLLLVEIGKVQGDFKRVELEKKDCYMRFKEAEEKRKLHEDADHEKEILLEDTRRIVEDLKAEKDMLRQNITTLLSQIASAELSGSRKENKSQRECEQKLEELRLQMQNSCDGEKDMLQHEATDQLNTMKKQLKLQYQETQQLDQMLQRQKQHPTEQDKKELQQPSNSPPLENNYIQQHGDIQKQQQQQQQQHKEQHQQQHEEQQHQQQHEEQQDQQQHEEQHQQQHEKQQRQQQHEEQLQREKQRELQQQNQINVKDNQNLPSGQQIQRRVRQSGSVGDHKRLRKVQANEGYRQIGKQSSGLRVKMDRRQVHGEKLDQQEQAQSKDTYRVRQGEQQQEERKERTEQDQREDVQRVQVIQPTRKQQETNDDEQKHGSTQVPSVGQQSQLEQGQRQRLLFKQSHQNDTVLAAPRGRHLATEASTSRAPGQLKEDLSRSDNLAADGDTDEHLQKRDEANEANGLVQAGNGESIDQPASVRPDEKNEQDHQDLNRMRQDWQQRNKNPYQPVSVDPGKPPEGNADV